MFVLGVLICVLYLSNMVTRETTAGNLAIKKISVVDADYYSNFTTVYYKSYVILNDTLDLTINTHNSLSIYVPIGYNYSDLMIKYLFN